MIDPKKGDTVYIGPLRDPKPSRVTKVGRVYFWVGDLQFKRKCPDGSRDVMSWNTIWSSRELTEQLTLETNILKRIIDYRKWRFDLTMDELRQAHRLLVGSEFEA